MTSGPVSPEPHVVLMYHSVCASPSTDSFRRYALTPAAFEQHLALIVESGWLTATVSGLACPDVRASTQPVVSLTFDDGFSDFFTNVLPLLERYNVVATLYVPTAFVGESALWLAPDGEADRRLLTWDELRVVAASGRVEIGAHSHTHPDLDRLDDAQLAEEIRLPKALLESHLHLPIRSFAYPFGYYSGRVRAAIRRAQYASACAVGDLPLTASSSRLALPRLTVTDRASTSDLRRMVNTPSTALRRARSGASRVVWQAYRRSASPRPCVRST